MKKNKNHISAWFLWESLALLHCSFSGNNGCKMQSAGVRTKDADHRHLSHTNALCAVFIAGTGKHPTEQIFPFFCRCFGNTEKARAMLEKYALDNGFENVLFLADDGYTGTNFERPSWKQVEEMIKRGEVETLIVKDLSRLGREYLQVGYYLLLRWASSSFPENRP